MFNEDEEKEDDMRLEHYLEIGAITIAGVDESGEMIFPGMVTYGKSSISITIKNK